MQDNIHRVLVKIECTPTCNEEIAKIIKAMKLPEEIDEVRSDFHCTLLFAMQCKGPKPVSDLSQTIVVKPTRFEQFGEAIVLILDDVDGKLQALHERVEALHEAKHSHDRYMPHTTLFYAHKKSVPREELDALFEQWPEDSSLVFEEVKSKSFALQ